MRGTLTAPGRGEAASPPDFLFEPHSSTHTRHTYSSVTPRASKLSVSPEFRDNLRIRTYDEPVRFNIIVIDEARCVFQPYLHDCRGVEAPTLVINKTVGAQGLSDTFSQVFESMWDRGKDLA